MAWTTPKTWTTSELLTAADLNTYVRDNSEYLYVTPQVAVRLDTDQEVADATDHTVDWDEAVWESDDSMWDVSAPSKIIIPRDGVYSIVCSMLWESATDGTKRAAFLEVDSVRRRGIQIPSVDPTEFQLCAETNLAEDDELEIVVRHLNGSALDLLATRTVMTVRWVGAPQVNV